MKRLLYPVLLMAIALIFGAMITTITAVTFASYTKDNKSETVSVKEDVATDEQLSDIVESKATNTNLSISR